MERSMDEYTFDCPYCEASSSHLHKEFVEYTGPDCGIGWECGECGAKWVEVYVFDHIEKGEW